MLFSRDETELQQRLTIVKTGKSVGRIGKVLGRSEEAVEDCEGCWKAVGRSG